MRQSQDLNSHSPDVLSHSLGHCAWWAETEPEGICLLAEGLKVGGGKYYSLNLLPQREGERLLLSMGSEEMCV